MRPNSLRRASFDGFQNEAQTVTLFRWVHRYLREVKASETGELHVQQLEALYHPMVEALFHSGPRGLFCSDQPWPERAVFVSGSLTELLPVRTLAEKTLFLVKALDRLSAQLLRQQRRTEARLVDQFLEYLQRILPERERPTARVPGGRRAVGF
jgi:hypothetical protein